MIRKKGILRKTFLFSSLLIVLVIALSFSILYLALPSYYLYRKQATLNSSSEGLVQALQAAESEEASRTLLADFSEANNATVLSFDGSEQLLLKLSTPFISPTGSQLYTVALDEALSGEDTEGRVSIATEGDPEVRSDIRIIINSESDTAYTSATTVSDSISLLALPVESEHIDHIVISSTLQPIDEASDVILSLIPWLLIPCVAVGVIMTYLFAKQLTKPILSISDAAVRMKRMEPGATAGVTTGDELGALSGNLDDLYAELMQSIDGLREEMDKVSALERSKTELMQSASHELKTPIAALNGIVEGMIDNVGIYKDRDRFLGECKQLIDRLSGLVGEILTASKSDTTGEEPVMEDIDVAGLMEQILAEQSILIQERRLRIEKQLAPCVVVSDRTLLHRAVSNLVSNAVRHTEPGGLVRVALGRRGDETRLTIENQCPPLPEDVLPKLLEPFYTRSYSRDRAESGTGLGLYIVKRSLEQLRIPFALENGEIGLRVWLDL